jgi:hypothetical protein
MAGRPLGVPNRSRFLTDEVKSEAFHKAWNLLLCQVDDLCLDPNVRQNAAKLLLAYSEGKPKESLQISGVDELPLKVSVEIVNPESSNT